MIAVLWALLGVMGYIAVAAVAFVYREDTWMRLLPSRLRHVAHKDRLAGVFAASTGLYENPDEDPASPTPTGPEPAKCEDCGWPWPLPGQPPTGAECDSCGGDLVGPATPRAHRGDTVSRPSRDEAIRSVIPADVLRNLDNPLRKRDRYSIASPYTSYRCCDERWRVAGPGGADPKETRE